MLHEDGMGRGMRRMKASLMAMFCGRALGIDRIELGDVLYRCWWSLELHVGIDELVHTLVWLRLLE